MARFKIYKAELRPLFQSELDQIIKNVPLEERIEPCPDCGSTEYWLYPNESVCVKEGMKPYGECLHCGFKMHL